jgi:hypothetical protein
VEPRTAQQGRAAGDRPYTFVRDGIGSTVSAFQVGTVVPSPLSYGLPGHVTPNTSTVRPLSKQVALVGSRLHADRKGRVRLTLRCPPAAVSCHGTVGLAALLKVYVGRGKHRHRALVRVGMARASFGVRHGQSR